MVCSANCQIQNNRGGAGDMDFNIRFWCRTNHIFLCTIMLPIHRILPICALVYSSALLPAMCSYVP